MQRIFVVTCLFTVIAVTAAGCSLFPGYLSSPVPEPEPEGIVVFADDFEGYASQEEFEAVWEATEGRERPQLTADNNHTPGGKQSLQILLQKAAAVNLRGLSDTEISLWIYSHGPGEKQQGFVRVRWHMTSTDAKDLLIGLQPDADTFVYRDTLAGLGWTKSEISASEGWHHVSVRIRDSAAQVWINGHHVYTSKGFNAVTSLGALDLWSGADAEHKPVYLDDIVVRDFSAAEGFI